MQTLSKNENEKETISQKIKDEFKLDSVVSIQNNTITITVASKKHDTTLANNIIRSIQSLYQENKYITVKFS